MKSIHGMLKPLECAQYMYVILFQSSSLARPLSCPPLLRCSTQMLISGHHMSPRHPRLYRLSPHYSNRPLNLRPLGLPVQLFLLMAIHLPYLPSLPRIMRSRRCRPFRMVFPFLSQGHRGETANPKVQVWRREP